MKEDDILNQLSNLKQHVKVLPDIAKIYDNIIDTPIEEYNCWGFTAYVLKLTTRLTWLSHRGMSDLLEKKTEVIEDMPKIGDIAVFRVMSHLTHTAIITSIYDDIPYTMHKCGMRLLAFDRIDNIPMKLPLYGLLGEYRRLKLKKHGKQSSTLKKTLAM